jgi:hypothetical protein
LVIGKRRGPALETRIYVPAKADPKIVQDLDARAILPMTRWYSAKKDAYLEDLSGHSLSWLRCGVILRRRTSPSMIFF